MSARLKLLPLISLFILMLGVVILGVLAVGTQTITLDGSVNFNVTDKSLWIKSASISNDNNAEEPISDFLPGYINSNFTLKISDQINTYGAFSLHLGIINTTTSAYDVTATYSGSVSGVTVTATPSQIPASSEEITEITSSTPSTQLDIIVANPNGDNINLSDITITFTEWQPQVYDFTFTTSGDTATLTSYTGTGGDVVIPSTFSIRVVDGQTQYIEGTDYTVTAIAAGTSSRGPFYTARSTLTSITIPETMKTIGNYAFNDCTVLTEINYNATAANDLTYGNWVFSHAGQDETGITVNVGANVTKLPSYIFFSFNNGSYSPNITTVNFAEGSVCESIGESAFERCLRLTSITIPESVTSIGTDAFRNCYALAEVYNYSNLTIPQGTSDSNVGYLGQYAKVVHDLRVGTLKPSTRITIVDNVQYYEYDSDFIALAPISGDINEISLISLDNRTTEINRGAFNTASRLTSITIPGSVTSIGVDSFANCFSLNDVTVESDDIYLDLTRQSAWGYLIYYVDATGEMVKVLKSVVDSVDPDFTNNTYLNNSSRFTRSVSEDGRYYVYTRN